MEYQLDKWKRQDWRKDTRHYCCEVRQNLFGQWVVLRRWGRVSAFQGQSREQVCDGEAFQGNRYEQSLEIFEAVEKRRAKRGYRGGGESQCNRSKWTHISDTPKEWPCHRIRRLTASR